MSEENNTNPEENNPKATPQEESENSPAEQAELDKVEKLSELGSSKDSSNTNEIPEPVRNGADKSNTNLATLRTLESDSQMVLREKDASMADVQQAERKKQREEEKEREQEIETTKQAQAEQQSRQNQQESEREEARAQQKKRAERETKEAQPEKTQQRTHQESATADSSSGFSFSLGISVKKAVWSSLVLFFFASALVTVGYVYFFQETPDEFAEGTVSPQEIIFANSRTEVDTTNLDDRAILKRIESIRKQPLEAGAVQNVYFTKTASTSSSGAKELVTTRTFLDYLNSDIPASLVRTFPEQFMFGYHGQPDGTKEAFLIFPINNYENAFAATLMWEGSMERDLLPLIGPPATTTEPITDDQIATTTETATGTPSTTTQPQATSTDPAQSPAYMPDLPPEQERLLRYYTAEPFVDLVVRNRDTRVLRKPDGGARLIYAFPRQQFLAITTSRQTLIEIFDRLSRRQFEGE